MKTLTSLLPQSLSVGALFAMLFADGLNNSQAQNIWTQKADFGGAARNGAIGFSIGGKGYVGTGGYDDDYYNIYFKKDFWEYDPSTNVWTQKADVGNIARTYAVGFSIGSKGYIGIGWDGNWFSPGYYNDFWEFDPDTNTWTQKADFGGTARGSAVGFSIGDKGYIGIGYGNLYPFVYADFWEYDPAVDLWSQKANFAGTARWSAAGFSIDSKGYIGTGSDGNYNNDFWEYDPVADGWTQKADFGGTARSGAVGFSIGSQGYIGTGADEIWPYYKNDFWAYDPATDDWTQKADFGGTGRSAGVGFSIGSNGYIGTGWPGLLNNDFWEYTPEFPTYASSLYAQEILSLVLQPNPTHDFFEIVLSLDNIAVNNFAKVLIKNESGQVVFAETLPFVKGELRKEIQLKNVADGIYMVKVVVNNEVYTKQLVISKQ